MVSVESHLGIVGASFVYEFLFFKQKTAYDMRISDWSSDVCSSDLVESRQARVPVAANVDFERRGDAECLELIYNPGPARFDRPIDEQAAHRRHVAALVDEVCLEAHAWGELLVGAQEHAMALQALGRAPCRGRVCQDV